MAQSNRIFLAGLGEVGRYTLEFLAREPVDLDIYAGDRDGEQVARIVDNVRIGSLHHGRTPGITPLQLDLLDIEATAAQLHAIQPRIVVNLAVLQTWHVIRQLPDAHYERLSSATLGAWLPVQLALAYSLARAIEVSGIETHYVNTSLSCLTNPVLGKVGLAPTVGIGNVDLIQPAVRVFIADRYRVPVASVTATLIAHHVHWVTPREAGYRKGAPFFLRASVDGRDVTEELGDLEALMHAAILRYHPDTSFSAVSASSTVKNVLALLSPTELATHSPAPQGLPGGYPLRISERGVQLDLPGDVSREQAVGLNTRASRFDGVDAFGEDGTVTFTDTTREIMRDMLGFDCPAFHVSDCVELAREQIQRYRAFRDSVV